MKAEEICAALRRHHSGHSQAIVFEVPDGVGNSKRTQRTADAIVINFWESRGLEIEGFEIKVERSDWQRELQMPAKADAHFVRCDRWWLVTPQASAPKGGVARAEEIPGPWGWMVITAKGEVQVLKKAPKLVPSVKFEKAFAFALVRAAARHRREEIAKEVERKVAERADDFTASVNAAAARLVKPAAVDSSLQLKLREAFGPSLAWLEDQAIVDAIKAVRTMVPLNTMRDQASALREAAAKIEAAAEALGAVKIGDRE